MDRVTAIVNMTTTELKQFASEMCERIDYVQQINGETEHEMQEDYAEELVSAFDFFETVSKNIEADEDEKGLAGLPSEIIEEKKAETRSEARSFAEFVIQIEMVVTDPC